MSKYAVSRMGFILVVSATILTVASVAATAQPLLEAEIVKHTITVATPLKSHRVNVDPAIVAERPEIEFDLYSHLSTTKEKMSGWRIAPKEEMSGSRLIVPEPKSVHRPEFEAYIVDHRIRYKESLVSERINYREPISWQYPGPRQEEP